MSIIFHLPGRKSVFGAPVQSLGQLFESGQKTVLLRSLLFFACHSSFRVIQSSWVVLSPYPSFQFQLIIVLLTGWTNRQLWISHLDAQMWSKYLHQVLTPPGSNIWGDRSSGCLVVGRCSQGDSSNYSFCQLQHGDLKWCRALWWKGYLWNSLPPSLPATTTQWWFNTVMRIAMIWRTEWMDLMMKRSNGIYDSSNDDVHDYEDDDGYWRCPTQSDFNVLKTFAFVFEASHGVCSKNHGSRPCSRADL